MDANRERLRVDEVGADQLADDLAALHRVATQVPGAAEDRLSEWLAAGRQALGVPLGLVLARTERGLVVLVTNCDETRPWSDAPALAVGDVVDDQRVDEAMARAATVATLGGGDPTTAPSAHDLGHGAVVVSPLWVSGRVSGAAVFVAPPGHPPFSTWSLACADIAADGVARVLEHQEDLLSLVGAESWADAVLRLIPDPVVRLDARGHVLGEDGPEPAVFDPCGDLREPGDRPDAESIRAVEAAVAATIDGDEVHTAHFSTPESAGDQRVEARFVPTGTGDVLCIVRDVTELHRVESALAQQVAFESLVASLSTRVIGGTVAALDRAIEEGLADVARFFGADGAVIRQLSNDGTWLHACHQWGRGGSDAPERIEVAAHPWLTGHWDRASHVFRRRQSDGDGAMDTVGAPGASATLWARLGHFGDLMGVMGLEWHRSEPPAQESGLGMIGVAADAFRGALRRRSIALLAEGQSDVFESIARGEPVTKSLAKARSLLERDGLGADVALLTVTDEGLAMLPDPEHVDWPTWFDDLALDLGNPYGQAVVSGEPVTVADAAGDPRFDGRAAPDGAYRAVTVQPVRSPRDGRTMALLVVLSRHPGVIVIRPAVRDSVVALVTVALEREADLRQLAYDATHDPLTGVGNRAALVDRLGAALTRARRSGLTVAVLFCDLDGFKTVNDSLGHDHGDRLLIEVASRIRSAVRPSDTVSRAGGDEFVVVCEELGSPEQASSIAERIYAAVEDTPVDLGEVCLSVRLSVGVALADLVLDDPDRLLRSADLAMYESKARNGRSRPHGRRTVPLGAPGEGPPRPTPDRFLSELGVAVKDGALLLHQQPMVGRDGEIAGVEALLRWSHPEYGSLGPERIVSGTAELGLATRLGRWVRREALTARRSWPGSERTGRAERRPPIHVNVAVADLVDGEFLTKLVDDLQDLDASPDDLVLEVREHDLRRLDVLHAVEDLHELSVPVIVDGVGADGLSLVDLADLPVRGIKLAPAIVRRLEDDPVAVEVVRSLMGLAHGLSWQSLAVGVETDRQRSVLFGFGIDAVQGMSVAMPADAETFGRWLTTRRASH